MSLQTIAIAGQKPCCISFNAPVSPKTASPLMGVITNMVNGGHDEVHLLLNTPGGTVADGIGIYNLLRAVPASIVTYNMGSVNSIGNVIYQAGNRRICAQTSSFMFHGVGFDIANARMELKQLKEKVDGIHNDQAMISDIMVRHTGLGSDDVDQLFLDMAFLSAQEALKRGITDEVRDIHLPQGLPVQQLVFQG